MAASSKKSLVAGLLANVAIAIVKGIAAALGGSAAMAAEAAHSGVDACNGTLLLLGRHRSKRPADEKHPFGYGGEVYFWTAIVATVVFLLGGGFSLAEGIDHLIHPSQSQSSWLSYLVLAVDAVFEGASLFIGVREFRRYRTEKRYSGNIFEAIRLAKNPNMFSIVLEDSVAIAGVVVAFLGIFLGQRLHLPELDGVASLVIAAMLMFIAVVLANESRKLIVGEPARRQIIDDIQHTLDDEPDIERVDEVRTLQLGPEAVLVALKVRVRRALGLDSAVNRLADIETTLKRQHPSIQYVLFSVSNHPQATP